MQLWVKKATIFDEFLNLQEIVKFIKNKKRKYNLCVYNYKIIDAEIEKKSQ